jgi:hypothetical protein
MVKKLESSVLKDMSLSDLKKHAKRLRKYGYSISGYSKLSDTSADKSTMRKMIRRAQKAGKSGGSSPKSSSPKKKSGCSTGFDNLTHCQKKTSAKRVKEIAEECGIEYTTKAKTCKALMEAGVDVDGGSIKEKKSSKTPSSAIKKTEAYIKLNKLKKRDNNGPDLQDKARKLKITYFDQDGDNITMGKLRKHELILAILKKKEKSNRKSTPTPPRKRSKKKSNRKRTPTPPPRKRSKKKSNRKRTPTPPRKRKKTPESLTPPPLPSRKYLRKTLRSKGLTTFPTHKEGMFTYLKAVNNNGRCDPEKGQWCNGEFVCDINNIPGVCLSPTQAQGLDSWEYQGKQMVGTSEAITALKKTLKTSKKRKDRPALPDPWSTEGLKRKKLINQIALATGRAKSYYKDWQVDTLRETLEGMEIENDRMLTKSNDQDRVDELNARLIMINQIVAVTGENKSVYKGYNFDEVMDKLNSLQDTDESDSSDDDEPLLKPSSAISDVSSESSASPTPPPKRKKKKRRTPTPVSSDSDSSDDEDSDRPGEGAEIVDVESTLANVIAGNKKIGELAKVQRSILKCMGLLS